jgi:hypothetical protein
MPEVIGPFFGPSPFNSTQEIAEHFRHHAEETRRRQMADQLRRFDPLTALGHRPTLTPIGEELEKLEKAKDGAYRERNQLAAALARAAIAMGFRAGVGEHPEGDKEWEPDWRTILFIDLPTGQLSWHFHDSEWPLLAGLPRYRGDYDGHSTAEKYRRLMSWRGEETAPAPECMAGIDRTFEKSARKDPRPIEPYVAPTSPRAG